MTIYTVQPSHLQGSVKVPASKSQTLRALLFASLAHGKSCIKGALHSPDSVAMMRACNLFGAQMSFEPDEIAIEGMGGHFSSVKGEINAGNSGIVLRFCTALAALSGSKVNITGDHSIRTQRPLAPLLSALMQLGASVTPLGNNGYAPVTIQGPLKGGTASVNGKDSQPVSALLIACALARQPSHLIVKDPGELPWVDLTLHWLNNLSIDVERNGYLEYSLKGGAAIQGFHYTVPGDLSTAAFPLAAALITGSSLTVANVDLEDLQGDKKLFSIWEEMGAQLSYNKQAKCLTVREGASLRGVDVDMNDCIDAVPILAVTACFAAGETVIRNASVAREKECNRLRAITNELSKMGADIIETEDGLRIRGKKLYGAKVSSHHDHRMALSLSVAALGADGETIVEDCDCIAKTYPGFYDDFCAIGANIRRMV